MFALASFCLPFCLEAAPDAAGGATAEPPRPVGPRTASLGAESCAAAAGATGGVGPGVFQKTGGSLVVVVLLFFGGFFGKKWLEKKGNMFIR